MFGVKNISMKRHGVSCESANFQPAYMYNLIPIASHRGRFEKIRNMMLGVPVVGEKLTPSTSATQGYIFQNECACSNPFKINSRWNASQ